MPQNTKYSTQVKYSTCVRLGKGKRKTRRKRHSLWTCAHTLFEWVVSSQLLFWFFLYFFGDNFKILVYFGSSNL